MVLKEALSAISITLIVFCTKITYKIRQLKSIVLHVLYSQLLIDYCCVVQCKEIF